jgi:hypothetical protein
LKPIAIDLFCGLGGWTEGLLAEGYEVTGYDIEAHEYGDMRYPAKLVLQDVLTIHGSEFKDADLIVASPPCQEYSYMAMPWSLAKAKAADIRADMTGQKLEALNRLFNACFRIQAEACEAAGRHIPMVVENVRGAIPWVGRSRWNFGSFHLWGDVPALMPTTLGRTAMKVGNAHRADGVPNFHGHKNPGFRFDGSGGSFQTASVQTSGVKAPGMNWSDPTKRGQDFTRLAGKHAIEAIKNAGHINRRDGADHTPHLTNPGEHGVKGFVPDGTKALGKHGHPRILPQIVNKTGSGSKARKAASAMIAKIPLALSRHIAATYHPGNRHD